MATTSETSPAKPVALHHGITPRHLLPDTLDLKQVNRKRLSLMAVAGCAVMNWHDILHRSGDTVISYLMADTRLPSVWDHIPVDDVIDPTSGSQFFFHRHDAQSDQKHTRHATSEIGHFHCFQQLNAPADGMIRLGSTTPAFGHHLSVGNGGPDGKNIAHLVAIGIDAFGLPNRIFTTNRWVTGESWCLASELIPLIDRFSINHGQPNFIVNQWVTEMIRLFQPQITGLLQARDAMLTHHANGQLSSALNDHNIEVTSELPISIPAQLAAIATALEKPQH
jgi:hypothetical protein